MMCWDGAKRKRIVLARTGTHSCWSIIGSSRGGVRNADSVGTSFAIDDVVRGDSGGGTSGVGDDKQSSSVVGENRLDTLDVATTE